MTITDTRPDMIDGSLSDPITFAMAFLKSPSQATRFDAVQLLALSGFRHANLSLIPLYQDWYTHPTGIALAQDIDAWFIDAANQLYGQADLPYTPIPQLRQWIDLQPAPRILPQTRTWPAWFWVLCGAVGGLLGGIIATR